MVVVKQPIPNESDSFLSFSSPKKGVRVRIQSAHTGSRRRAVATVEFAVVVPIFFIFVFGIIEVGRGLMITHLLGNSAREGCRLGIIEGKTTSDIRSAVTTVLSSQGISGQTTSVAVNDVVADASTANAGDEITVSVRVPVGNISWVPGTHYLSGNLSGSYSLRRE